MKPGIKERFAAMRAMGIRTVMVTGDNPVTAAAIASEAGVDDFLAEATPEDKLAYIRKEQFGGRLIAMCGDGTNDAPALAQADVGVAMQTGTQAAREAGNMVDLDSNPTKLIEIVEIGKQLLMTRGSLTTFSIANDVAKYFAILPAMFVVAYPALGALNVMRLASSQSAILSAVIFNALIIIALIPLALEGRRLPAGRRRGAAAAQSPDLWRWAGSSCPSSASRRSTSSSPPCISPNRRGSTMLQHLRPALVLIVLFTVLTGLVYPLAVTGIAQIAMPYQANGSLIQKDGAVVGSALIGQWFKSDRYFHPRPSATTDTDPNDSSKTIDAPYNAANSTGSNLGPTSQKLVDRVKGGVAAWRAMAGPGPVPADAVTTSASGLDPHVSPQNRVGPGRVGRQGARTSGRSGARVGRRRDRSSVSGVDRRAEGQCFAAEFGAGSVKIVMTTDERRWPNRADPTMDAPTRTRFWPRSAGRLPAG